MWMHAWIPGYLGVRKVWRRLPLFGTPGLRDDTRGGRYVVARLVDPLVEVFDYKRKVGVFLSSLEPSDKK